MGVLVLYKDLMNLKIYDKKYDNNESLVEIYDLSTNEFKGISENIEKLIETFKPLKIAVEKLDEKIAINKIILYWVAYFNYFSRTNFLINVVKISERERNLKGKTVKEFSETAHSLIIKQVDSALDYAQFHISYFYFKLFEVRNEINIGGTIEDIYLRAFQSSIEYFNSQSSNNASKISEEFMLESLLRKSIIEKVNLLEKIASEDE